MTAKHWTFGMLREETRAILLEPMIFPSLAELKAERIKAMRDRKSLLRIAANRQSFPLYKNGRMLVSHPDYEKGFWTTDVPMEP